MIDAGVITKHASDNKFAMYKVCVIAAYKAPSRTQSTVFYCHGKVNRSICWAMGGFNSIGGKNSYFMGK